MKTNIYRASCIMPLTIRKWMNMTTEQRNQILERSRKWKSVRDIVEQLNFPKSTVGTVAIKKKIIRKYAECSNCGKVFEIAFKNRGRPRTYCSKKCQRADVIRRNFVYTCQVCGKRFRYYSFEKSNIALVDAFSKQDMELIFKEIATLMWLFFLLLFVYIMGV